MVPGWVAERVGAEVWEGVGGGYTLSLKWRARLPDGTRVFVKAAAEDELTLRPLEREIVVYESVQRDFLPAVRDIHLEDGRALLVLEDLSQAHWPPPYPADVAPIFTAPDEVAATPAPPRLRRLPEGNDSRWARFTEEPSPLLALGLFGAEWLGAALPVLIQAESRVPLVGNGLVHFDVWADNMCFTARGAVLVDWAEARIGNPRIDVAFALLSLRVEGASTPPVADEPALAAFVTGVIAAEASSPSPAWAAPGSTLREDQRRDLQVALPWAADQLGLPPPA
jgi:hypothetical protein